MSVHPIHRAYVNCRKKNLSKGFLLHLLMINNGKANSKPILLKISPDLSNTQIDDIIDLALEIKLDGIVSDQYNDQP